MGFTDRVLNKAIYEAQDTDRDHKVSLDGINISLS